MKQEILDKLSACQKLFNHEWHESQLSDSAWLALVGVPWLLQQVENNGKNDGGNGNPDSDPRPDGVGTAKPSLQFVFSKQPMPSSVAVVPSGDPIADVFGGFLAELERVGFLRHVIFIGRQNSIYS
jgi:hypothetical protein